MNTLNKHLPAATTTLLGGVFLLFGLNGFLHFIPMSPPEGQAGAFLGGLAAAGYFFPMLALTQVAVGIALLTRRLVPLALIVLAPVSLNILAFHLALDPKGLPMALFVVLANAGLAYHHRDAYRGLFQATTKSKVRRATVASI